MSSPLTQSELEKLYPNFANFIGGSFVEMSYRKFFSEEALVEEAHQIARELARQADKYIKATVAEGKEVLRLNPFPYEALNRMGSLYQANEETGRAWLRGILQAMEDEIARQEAPPNSSAYKNT